MKTHNTHPSLKGFFLILLSVLVFACQNSTKTGTEGSVKAPKETLHEAAFMGNTKAIQQHIDAGSDLNVKDAYGSTPLNVAITFDKTEIAKMLIDASADIHATSADGSTPLHTASFLCRVDIVAALLEKGADTQLTNTFGSTPLQSVEVPFDAVKPVYDQLSRDLGPLGFKLDYELLEKNRPVIAEMLAAQ